MAKKAKDSPAPSGPEAVYQLKVTLDGIRPPIWRRIQVRGDISLFKLHNILQDVMGWTDEHLHHFVISDETYSVVSRDGVMIGDDSTDEKKIKLNKVIPGEKFKFTYEYDFGDSWLHNILVEKIFVPDEELKAPVCLKGKRCTPPEDCGGIGGYYHLCRVVGDPDHPEHAEMLDWIGYEYDPEYFSAEIVTAQLQHLR